MDMPFKCPHCGSNAFRLLKGCDVLECVACGKTGAFTGRIIASADEDACKSERAVRIGAAICVRRPVLRESES
jgi:hypothetical protein